MVGLRVSKLEFAIVSLYEQSEAGPNRKLLRKEPMCGLANGKLIRVLGHFP